MTELPSGLAEWVEGRSDEAHDLADQIEPILRAKACSKSKPTITYGELSAQVGGHPRSPIFTDALAIVSYRTLMRNGYALSALVVNKETGLPGKSFYPLVGGTEELDLDDQIRLFNEQFEEITGSRGR